MAVSGDWTYTESGGNATITDYSGSATPTIPTSLDGYPVIAVASYAMDNKSLQSITFNHNITVGENSFAFNSGIDVYLNANLTSTGTSINPPFEDCSIGTGIYISATPTSIPQYLFANCGLSGTLTIPNNITSIGTNAFWNNNITAVVFDYPVDLANNCFQYNTGIDVYLNANITCNAVTSSLYSPFEDCSIGTGIYISSTPTSIPQYLFSSCGLTGTLTIPENITSLENYSFSHNASLTGLNINSSLTSISNNCFRFCGLTGTLTIPNNITSIGTYSFASNSIDAITFGHAMNLDDNCFESNGTMSIVLDADITTSVSTTVPPFRSSIIGNNLTITSNVTTIPNYLFINCNLSSVTIPSSVTSIGTYAFGYNDTLETVYIYTTSATGSSIFYNNNPSNGIIYGYENTSGEYIASLHASNYTFQSLDKTINLQSGNITFTESSATPSYELSATVILSVGILELGTEDVTLEIPFESTLNSGTLTFNGNTITVDDGVIETVVDSTGGLELFIYLDLL